MTGNLKMLCSGIALATVLGVRAADARTSSDCDFDETGNKLRCGVHEPIEISGGKAPQSELPTWLLGTWTGDRGDGTQVSLTWVDRGGVLEGLLEETAGPARKELRRFSIGSRVPVLPQFRSYSLSLWVRTDRAQYLFAGYSGASQSKHVRFDRILKRRGVTASSYVAATELSQLDGELILVDMIGPQHGAMPERRLVFRRAAPDGRKPASDGGSR